MAIQSLGNKTWTHEWPLVGCGVGLRSQHYDDALRTPWPGMDWFEATSENFMDTGGKPISVLERVRKDYPVGLHGVSLSIGSVDVLDLHYLNRLRGLIHRIEPVFVSDHLCWTGVEGERLHDLLPLPLTEEAFHLICERVEQIQSHLGLRFLLENISTYIAFPHSTIPEWEFLSQVAKRAGCGILLDLNNIYVNSVNHGFDPYHYLDQIPGAYVAQFHLAGHTDMGTYLFDTHSAPVIDPVWKLYQYALELWGPVSTLIEWDENLPAFEALVREAGKAKAFYQKAVQKRSSPHAFRRGPTGSNLLDPRLKSRGDDNVLSNPVKAKSPTLLESQRWLKQSILSPVTPASERLAVYSRGYVARLAEAMGEIYESVRHAFGKTIFTRLIQAYLEMHPPRSYNLNFVGSLFPQFVKEHPLGEKFPFMADLAFLDAAVYKAFHSSDEPPLEPGRISIDSSENLGGLKLTFQPSFSLMESRWPILDLWKLRKAPASEMNPKIEESPQCLWVYRKNFEVYCEIIHETGYKLATGLKQGKTLGEVVEDLSDEIEDPGQVTQWFSRLMQEQLITGYELASQAPLERN